jgi:hypothetical protein
MVIGAIMASGGLAGAGKNCRNSNQNRTPTHSTLTD